jgi:uroporphyrinogen-III synthase
MIKEPAIWVTRTLPDAGETGVRLRQLGYTPVVAPLLRVEHLPTKINLAEVARLVFTSRNAVRLFKPSAQAKKLPVFAVGDRTAVAARAAGYRHVHSASGDVERLAELILSLPKKERQGNWLHLGALEPAGDLPGLLNSAGIAMQHVALYHTIPTPAEDIAHRVRSGPRLAGVLIHSPKAAHVLGQSRLVLPANSCAVCISKTAADALAPAGLRSVLIAASPTEDAMFQTLVDHLPSL